MVKELVSHFLAQLFVIKSPERITLHELLIRFDGGKSTSTEAIGPLLKKLRLPRESPVVEKQLDD